MFEFLDIIPHPLAGTPYGIALNISLAFATITYLLTLATRESAWVDRRTEIFPPICCLIVAGMDSFDSARLNLMTLLVLAWSVRLSHTCYRKGGFNKGGSDYRWDFLLGDMNRFVRPIFHFLYIGFGHMLAVWIMTAPLHGAWLGRGTPLGWLDLLASILFLVFFLGEAIADQQMWEFQEDKKRKLSEDESVAPTFMKAGFWRYCRHPSWLCELGMWSVFYLFSVSATESWLNWTIVGLFVVSLSLVGSVRITESISLRRYEDYAVYQKSTPCLIPLLRIPNRGREIEH